MLNISTKFGVKAVEILRAGKFYGQRAFLHESFDPEFKGTYKLSEFSTGFEIANGRSSVSAVKAARRIIKAQARMQACTPQDLLTKRIAAIVAEKGRVNE